MDTIRYLQTYRPKVYTGPTSMVTLLIPAQTNLDDLRRMIKTEANTASNIRNNTNRKSVLASLSSITSHLKTVKKVPATGMAMFAEQYI